MIDLNRHIGHTLSLQRGRLGLTQDALARRLGKTQSYVARLESGKRDPQWGTVLEFARALELEPMLIPRERLAAVDAVLQLTASHDVPPLTGGDW